MKKIILLTLISLILLVGCYNETETPSTATTLLTTTTVTAKETITNEATTMVIDDQEENELNLTWVSDSILTYVELEDSDIDELNDYMFEVCTNKLSEQFGNDTYISNIKTGKYDVNDDSQLDCFVLAFPANHDGSSAVLMLFLNGNTSSKGIFISIYNEECVTLLNSRTNGLYDIMCGKFGNTLYYNGTKAYYTNQGYDIALYNSVDIINENIACFEVSTDLSLGGTDEYDNFILIAYFYDTHWMENKVVLSNDINFNNITYNKPTSTFKFHVDISDIDNIDELILYDAYNHMEIQVVGTKIIKNKPKPKKIHFNGKDYLSTDDFLRSDEGVDFQKTAFHAAIAFMKKDVDELLKYYTDNEENIQKLLEQMELESYRYNEAYFMELQVDIESYDNFISAWYKVLFNNLDSADYVTMYSFMDDDGEWKIDSIFYTR